MRRFARLFDALDTTTSTNAKVAAMRDYFAEAEPADAAWAVFFLTGERFKRLIRNALYREWTMELTGMPEWLFEEAYNAVGDTGETIALLLDNGGVTLPEHELPLHVWVEERIRPLREMDEEDQKAQVVSWWAGMERRELFLLNKILRGGLRVGISKTLVQRALSEWTGLPRETIAHRLMGSWEPSAAAFEALVAEDDGEADLSRPYPFFLAYPIEDDPAESLGRLEDWQVEEKWDGIRAQLIRREGETFIWSRGEELVTERYPELAGPAASLPNGTALDGELLAWADGQPLPFAVMQQRIGRKRIGKKTLAEAPVRFMAYDLLEQGGEDLRELTMRERRARLEDLLIGAHPDLLLSGVVRTGSWTELAELRDTSRQRRVEGFMLKRLDSRYGVGRTKGDWWKWKVDPLTVDAVLIYAQAGSGKRASLFTDYTFAVWNEGELTPLAKAYSGLDNEEIRELDRWIRKNTKERFGPVRSVEPTHVFEIAFENIAESSRHKSGVAVRFPRIARWRRDKPVSEANTLDDVKHMLRSIDASWS